MSILNAEARAETYCAIASALNARGDIESSADVLLEALDSARDIEFSVSRASALGTVATTQFQCGAVEDAARTATEIVRTIRGVARERWAVRPLAQAGGLLARAGHHDESASALGLALDVARADDDSYFVAEGVQEVVAAWLSAGQLARARQIISEIAWTYDRARAQALVVCHLVTVGLLADARATAEALEDPETKARCLSEIAATHARRGEVALATAVFATIPTGLDHDRGAAVIAGALADGGHLLPARDHALRVCDPECAVRAWLSIARSDEHFGRGSVLDADILAAIDKVTDPRKRSLLSWERLALLAKSSPSRLLDETKAYWWASEGRDSALREIAKSLATIGRIHDALAVADRIGESRDRALAVAQVAGALGRHAALSEAAP
jgi:hypothetical protein